MIDTLASVLGENRSALVHRVIMPDRGYPREYVILVTDKRSIFVRQPVTRRGFVLRGEMKYGTALVTDVVPKTLEDYEEINLDSLAGEDENIAIPHAKVGSFVIGRDEMKFRLRELFVWLVMSRQKERFQVYNVDMDYNLGNGNETIKFYAVPLGAYFKPRRMTQSRETILREYAMDILETYRKVLPANTVSMMPKSLNL